MKILFVSLNHTPEQTGIGKFHGEMAAWMVARGHDVRVVTAPPYYPAWKVGAGYTSWLYKNEIIDGAHITRCPLYVPAVPSGLKRLVHLVSFAFTSLPVILWQAVRWKPDAIMTTAPPLMTAPTVWLAAQISGARSLLHIQDFEVDAAFNLGMLRKGRAEQIATRIESALLRAYPAVSTISRRMRERLVNKGVAIQNTYLVPNWASVTDFDPAQGSGNWSQRLKKNPDDIIALYSGNLGRKQGVETIVETARLMRDNPRIRFVICGDGAARKEMEASAVGLENLTFLPIQEMPEFIHLMIAADIHLLPQRAEAADLVMPSKLGNILASGKPVIAGANQGTQIYDAVQGCGIAVPPDNAPAFAAALTTLSNNPNQRIAMGLKGRQRALIEWGKDSILSQLEQILEQGHVTTEKASESASAHDQSKVA